MMRTTNPTCSMPGCDQEIYLRPDERTVCEGCRLRGGPPPAAPKPKPVDTAADWGTVTVCACGRPILMPDRSGDQCMRCHS